MCFVIDGDPGYKEVGLSEGYCVRRGRVAHRRRESVVRLHMRVTFSVSRMWFSFGVSGKKRKDVRLFDVSTVQVRSFSSCRVKLPNE